MVVVVEELEEETMLVMIISAIIRNVTMPKVDPPLNTCFACVFGIWNAGSNNKPRGRGRTR